MKLSDLISDADVLLALEPDELGLRILPWIARFPPSNRQLEFALRELAETYPGRGVQHLSIAVREAWAWLEGTGLLIPHPSYSHSIKVLSRRASKIAEEADSQRPLAVRRLPKEVLHPRIREDVWALYHRGKYDTAVFEAMKAVEVAVRNGAGLSTKDVGTGLMRTAFHPENGPLTDTRTEKAEREARVSLFAGAIGSYKNPHSHRDIGLEDFDEAVEIIMLANHLLRIVDTRVAAQVPTALQLTATPAPASRG